MLSITIHPSYGFVHIMYSYDCALCLYDSCGLNITCTQDLACVSWWQPISLYPLPPTVPPTRLLQPVWEKVCVRVFVYSCVCVRVYVWICVSVCLCLWSVCVCIKQAIIFGCTGCQESWVVPPTLMTISCCATFPHKISIGVYRLILYVSSIQAARNSHKNTRYVSAHFFNIIVFNGHLNSLNISY